MLKKSNTFEYSEDEKNMILDIIKFEQYLIFETYEINISRLKKTIILLKMQYYEEQVIEILYKYLEPRLKSYLSKEKGNINIKFST
jgi:hypothetical protein